MIKTKKSLAETHPELAKEWDYEKNGELTPENVTKGSRKKVFWICSERHSYDSVMSSRNSMKSGCPYCAGKKVCKDNCLSTTNPEIAKEWHPIKNGELTPEDVTKGSSKKVWWLCSEGHSYPAIVQSRTNIKSGCPYCSGRRVCKDNCLSTTHPEISKEWDYKKNGGLTPKDITVGSGKKVFWICSEGHSYSSTINNKISGCGCGCGCSYCSGRTVCEDNCLSATHPELSEEWNHEKNGELTPEDVTYGSNKKVFWICSEGHSYDSIIASRSNGRGCPTCNSGWTIPSIKNYLKSIQHLIPIMNQPQWYHLLNSSGILNIDPSSKGYKFVQKISNKEKLDFDELGNLDYDDIINNEDVSDEEENNFINNDDFHNEIDHITQDPFSPLKEHEPFISIEKAIAALPSMDKETIEAIIGEEIWLLIQMLCENEKRITDIRKKVKHKYSKEAQKRILNIYKKAKKLKLPKNYNLRDNNEKLIKPYLMQRLAVVMLKDKQSMLNLSGTGAGKTLFAIWASYYINSKLTVIVCPNDIKEMWKKRIKEILPSANNVLINDFNPKLKKNVPNRR